MAKAPVLFVDRSRPRQAWEAVGGAVVTGIICGVLLGVAWWAYLIAVVATFVLGAPNGAQHRTLGGALLRGAVGGGVWAGVVLAVSVLTTLTPTVALPEPHISFFLWGIIPSFVAAGIAWVVTRSRRRVNA
jgi:hypothetical protein